MEAGKGINREVQKKKKKKESVCGEGSMLDRKLLSYVTNVETLNRYIAQNYT